MLAKRWGLVAFIFATLTTIAAFAVVKTALAQVEATSTDSSVASSTSTDMATSSSENSSEQIAQEDTGSSSSSSAVIDGQAAGREPSPEGLTEVHVIGTKYIDYFTDGTHELAFPGDLAIDELLNQPDTRIPAHEGLTWVRTIGQNLYDTPSGDLEPGQYARQLSGAYIAKPFPFVSSTSTAPETNSEVSSSTEGTTGDSL